MKNMKKTHHSVLHRHTVKNNIAFTNPEYRASVTGVYRDLLLWLKLLKLTEYPTNTESTLNKNSVKQIIKSNALRTLVPSAYHYTDRIWKE